MCDFCTDFNIKEAKLKEINLYECTNLDGERVYELDIERPNGIIPELWRNKPLKINFCPICGRKLMD